MSEVKKIFTEIYEKNLWTSQESNSGAGSELKNTEVIRREIPEVIKKFGIKSILDIPCGDFNWMKSVDLSEVSYMGADIVESLVEINNKKFDGVNFQVLDIIQDELPKTGKLKC